MDQARRCIDAMQQLAGGLDDRAVRAKALGSLATLEMRQGRLDEARVLFERTLAAYLELADRAGEGRTLTRLGLLHSEQGRLAQAERLYLRALELHCETGSRYFEGITLSNLGIVRHGQGRTEESLACYRQALAQPGEAHRAAVAGVMGIRAKGRRGVMRAKAHRTRNSSSPAKAGDPVRRGFSALSLASLEYWIARPSAQ